MKSSLGSYKILGVLELFRVYRSKSVAKPRESSVVVAAARNRVGVSINGFGNAQLAGLRFVHAAAAASSGGIDGTQPISPPSPKPPAPRPPSPPNRGRFPLWAKLVLGSVVTLLLALWTPNWTTLLKIGGEAEVVIKDGEQVAEVVEKVAAVVEKVSEEVADSLPDGNKLKEVATIIDLVSKEAAKDAQIADELLHKLDVVKQDVEDVEKIVKPIIDKIEHDGTSNKHSTS